MSKIVKFIHSIVKTPLNKMYNLHSSPGLFHALHLPILIITPEDMQNQNVKFYKTIILQYNKKTTSLQP